MTQPKTPQRGDFASLTDWLYATLRARLLAGQPQAGERLATARLAREHQVSLAAVREALSRLAGEGLVVQLPQRGFRVAPTTRDDLREISLALAEMNALCLRMAARRGQIGWRRRLQSATEAARERLRQAPRRPAATIDATPMPQQLLDALIGGCELQELLQARQLLQDRMARYLRAFAPLGSEGDDPGHGSHPGYPAPDDIAIAEAALDRDPDLAAALIAARTRRLGDALQERMA